VRKADASALTPPRQHCRNLWSDGWPAPFSTGRVDYKLPWGIARSGASKDDRGGVLKSLADRFYAQGDATKKPPHYFDVYESFFERLRDEPLDMLELGVSFGASLRVWREYFRYARIVGLDIKPLPAVLRAFADDAVVCVQGDQSEPRALSECLSHSRSGKFDIIIDDASHVGTLSKASFDFLFTEALADGGLYFIEDYGTGYMSGFPDGAAFEPDAGGGRLFPSHQNGMVGWVKQLIDELHGPLIFAPGSRTFPLESVFLWRNTALVKKLGNSRFVQGAATASGGNQGVEP
jgi:hypothetical protein